MKKNLLLATIFLALGLSCQKEYLTYSGPNGVYFAVRYGGEVQDNLGPYQPSSYIEFVKLNTDSFTCRIPIMLAGEVKNYDRVFKVIVDTDSTTLQEVVNYKKLASSYTLAAGENSAIIPIDFYATSDLDNSQKRIDLQIVTSEDLAPVFSKWDPPTDITGIDPPKKFDASRHSIYVTNMMVKPAQWLGSILTNGEEFNSLGAFSRKKMEFITEQLGITYNDFLNQKTMSLLRMGLIGSQMARILIERYQAGYPVLEQDGRLMYFQGVPWKSYIGLAYKP